MGSATYKNWGGGTSDNINLQFYSIYTVYYYTVLQYIYRGGARILVWGGTSEKISYMNFFQVLYCNGVSKISVGRKHSAQIYLSKTFEKF